MGSRATPPTTTGRPYSKHVQYCLGWCQACDCPLTALTARLGGRPRRARAAPCTTLPPRTVVGRGTWREARRDDDDPQISLKSCLVLILVIQTASRDSVYYTKIGVGTGGVVDMPGRRRRNS
eukprot:scaffold10126_cov56-Phaeocystis_antarctica.AAC.3